MTLCVCVLFKDLLCVKELQECSFFVCLLKLQYINKLLCVWVCMHVNSILYIRYISIYKYIFICLNVCVYTTIQFEYLLWVALVLIKNVCRKFYYYYNVDVKEDDDDDAIFKNSYTFWQHFPPTSSLLPCHVSNYFIRK